MKRIILFILLTLPVFVFSQIPNINPRNIRLLYQTTGDGIIWRGNDTINYTPTTVGNAWMHLDTINNRLYSYVNNQWTEISSFNIDSTSLSNRIDLKLNISDTMSMLSTYLKKIDTLSLSNRINQKFNSSDTVKYVKFIDTLSSIATKANLNLKLNSTDTISLSNRINLKLNSVDTASLSNRINLKLNATDTVSLSNRINLKLNTVDTISLSNRINGKLDTFDNVVKTKHIENNSVTVNKVGPGVVTTASGITNYIPYFVSTDSLANSVVRQESSKIGVGISPDSTFTVNGSGRFVNGVTANKFYPTGNITFGTGMYAPTSNSIAFSTSGVERFRISEGINWGSVTTKGLLTVEDANAATIIIDRTNLSNLQRMKFISSNTDYSLTLGQFNNSGNAQTQIAVDSSGKVGIGTLFPSERLHVQGKLVVTDLTKSGNSRGIVGYQSDGTLDTVIIGSGLTLSSDVLSASAAITSGTLTSGAVSVQYSVFGTSVPTLTYMGSPGIYKLTMSANTNVRSIVFTANNTVLSGINDFTFIVDNAANSIDQWFNVQMYDVATGAFIDQHSVGTNHTQLCTSNVTTIVFPGMNLFDATGFRIVLK